MNLPKSKIAVMIIDDDPVSLEVTQERLRAAGYSVETRQSSLGSSAAILRSRPHVILLDVNMPGLSGDALARLVNNRNSDYRPVILLHSSRPRLELSHLVRACGADGAIEKTPYKEKFLTEFEKWMTKLFGKNLMSVDL